MPKHAKESIESQRAQRTAAHSRAGAKKGDLQLLEGADGAYASAVEGYSGAQAAAGEEISQVAEPVDGRDFQTAESEKEASVAKSTTLMSLATLMSRMTGLVRTWAMAFALGNTLYTSAYQVANNLPNAVYDLVAGGLLGAAFIPIFLQQFQNIGKRGAVRFSNNVLNLVTVILGALSVLACICAPAVIATQTFTVGDANEVTQYSIAFFRIFAFQIVFYGIGGVITGILNANRVYFLPALAPAVNNVVVIASFFIYIPLSSTNPEAALIVLAVGTTLGVVAQFVVQIPALRKSGYRWRWYLNLHDPSLIAALKVAIPTTIYIVGMLVAFSCRNAFSLQASDIGPSTLLYAWMWYQLPYGVVAVSLSRTMFTEMSDDVAQGDQGALRHHVESGISGTLLLIIPLASIIFVLATPIIQLFQAGAFNADDVAFVAYVLESWLVSLPFYSVLMYLYNVYASIRRFGVFAAVSTVGVAVQVVLYAWLCQADMFGVVGVCYADFIYYCGCCIILLVVLRRIIGPYHVGRILWAGLRTLVAAGIGAVVIYMLQTLLPFRAAGMLGGLGTIIICGIAGIIIMFGLCALFRIPQMRVVVDLLARFRRR